MYVYYIFVYVLNISQSLAVYPQAPVLHLPAASVLAECFPAGTYATGEMEAQVARHYW